VVQAVLQQPATLRLHYLETGLEVEWKLPGAHGPPNSASCISGCKRHWPAGTSRPHQRQQHADGSGIASVKTLDTLPELQARYGERYRWLLCWR